MDNKMRIPLLLIFVDAMVSYSIRVNYYDQISTALLNNSVTLPPNAVTAPTDTKQMKPIIRAYSTIVDPSSASKKSLILHIVVSLL